MGEEPEIIIWAQKNQLGSLSNGTPHFSHEGIYCKTTVIEFDGLSAGNAESELQNSSSAPDLVKFVEMQLFGLYQAASIRATVFISYPQRHSWKSWNEFGTRKRILPMVGIKLNRSPTQKLLRKLNIYILTGQCLSQ